MSTASDAGTVDDGPGKTRASAESVPSGATGCSTSGSPISIGTVGVQSGIVGAVVGKGPKAVQAWAASVNASQGGVSCHRIRYIVYDDGGDPSRHQALMQQLIERDHALAVVHLNAVLTGSASVRYLNEKRVPVIGSDSGGYYFYESPMHFPQVSSGNFMFESQFAATHDAAQEQGMTKVATVSCVESSLCSALYDLGPALAEKYGFTLVYRGRGTLVQPDFTAQCQAAQSAGAEIMLTGLDTNSIRRLAKSCDRVNFRPLYGMQASILTPDLVASEPLLDGATAGSMAIPWFMTSNPSVAQFLGVLREYAPALQPEADTMLGWVSALLFAYAAKDIPEPPTTRALLERLWSLHGDDLGGTTLPLIFAEGQPPPPKLCYWTLRASRGRFVTMNGGQRVCP